MQDVKVSIIIPVYNVEKYLEQCLKSVINQTYSNIEILLIDDGSPDSSPTICDSYAQKDNRIRVIHQENAGVSVARNKGLDLATGEYVYFLDADDWIEENAIEVMVSALKEEALDCLGFGFVKEFDNISQIQKNEIWETTTYKEERYDVVYHRSIGFVNADMHHFHTMNAFAVIWSKLYKKSIIDAHGIRFPDIKQLGSFEDGLFNIHFFRHAKNFKFLDASLYHYRKNNLQSIASNYKTCFYEKQKLQMACIRELIGDSDKNALEAYNNRVAYMAMEYCSNVLKNKANYATKRGELKRMFRDREYANAIKVLRLNKLPMVWKVYYMILKLRSILGTYAITKMLLNMRKSGKGR